MGGQEREVGDIILASEPSPYMKPCPKCGALMPKNVKGRWNCAYVLDPHIIELAKADKAAKK